ncbi:MAG TPA: hypothetical protein VJH69_03860 [Candidatus Paceibacterota bacterium]
MYYKEDHDEKERGISDDAMGEVLDDEGEDEDEDKDAVEDADSPDVEKWE